MFVDDKWHIRRTKQRLCRFMVSMNLAPESEFTKEERRVSIRFRDDTDEEDERDFEIRMSRKEAKSLGERLLDYGNRTL